MTLGFSLEATLEHWPLAGAFTISRGSKTEAVVVTVEITDGTHTGRGECVPYARYFESPESVMTFIEMMEPHFARGMDRMKLQHAMPAGAARNALDCAFWDLECKKTGCAAHELAGLPEPKPVIT